MSLHAGGALFPVLVMVHLAWDWKHGGFRGILLQILGALCLGTILNAILNPQHFSLDRVEIVIVIYGVLAIILYWWAWIRRQSIPR